MERKIGEIFEFGGAWYQCVKGDLCADCAFAKKHCNENPLCEAIGRCNCYRKDGNEVIFKKLEKVGEPFERNGYMYQEYKTHTYPLLMSGGAKIPTDNGFAVIIKQNKEDMEENKTNWREADTPLTRLVGRYVNNLINYDTFEKGVKELYSDKEEIKPTLKEFDLEAAKLGKPVCTRDGRKARIICFDSNGGRPIVALVTECDDEEEIPYKYHCDGSYNCQSIPSDNDLMMLSEKHEGWINVYKERTYDTKEEAISNIAPGTNYIYTTKVEWEE